MSDDHLPKSGQFCPDCNDHNTDHYGCWEADVPDDLVQLFTEVHDVIKGAA